MPNMLLLFEKTRKTLRSNSFIVSLLRAILDGETRFLTRKDLINTLYAALPPATVKFGCQLGSIKLDPHSTKPVLRFIDGSSIIAKVVIGCDGGKSIIADFLNLKSTKMFPLREVRGLTNYPNGHSFGHEFTRFTKDNILVGIAAIDNNSVYWFCVPPNNPNGRLSSCLCRFLGNYRVLEREEKY